MRYAFRGRPLLARSAMMVSDEIIKWAQANALAADRPFRLFLTCAIILHSTFTSPVLERIEKPNIVVIFAADLGWADLSAYGNVIIEAPNINRLAQEGARFTRFYTQPVCSPSRAELMSGNYPARYGLTDLILGYWHPFEKVITPRTATRFYPSEPALGEVLRASGYRTGYFGKWHLGELGPTTADLGFDEWSNGYQTFFGGSLLKRQVRARCGICSNGT